MEGERERQLVLVTGGSGFIGMHCILQLLAKSYRVRTTVRSLSREASVRETLYKAGVRRADPVEFIVADLQNDEGWVDAVAGCTYVLHVASPFPAAPPKHEDELIVPARDGTIRVLRAARDAGVKRVVVTSSFAAIGYGQPTEGKVFTEDDWTPTDDPSVPAYQRSKTFAERAAWEFMKSDGGTMELAVVNPVGVFGPLLGSDLSTSVMLIKRMIAGEVPALPRMALGVVDVRDVADLHLRAMTDHKAAGQRFLCISGQTMWVKEMAVVLQDRLGTRARKVKTAVAPDFLLRIMAMFDAQIGLVVGELGKKKMASNDKAKTLLGWTPIPPEDSIVATAESLIATGIVKV